MFSKNTIALAAFVLLTVQIQANNRQMLPQADKEALLSALQVNEKMHQAFLKYDAQAAQTTAMEFERAIKAIKNQEISQQLTPINTHIAGIKAQNDRKTNNNNYHQVSLVLAGLLAKYDLGSDYHAYYCPMVKKKWIQNSKKMSKVHNPYAPKMVNCGMKESKY